MGHVDHGKTSLLDYIRKTKVAAGEAGGITQHVGAYEVETDDGKRITFLDTPGHEAFTAMRSRGAQATDIVILVVAADDSVMPQTIEAINHAKAAGVPMIIAINKMDKEGANPDRIKGQLSEHGVIVEEYGGSTQVAEVSAHTGMGIADLLDKVLIEAELLELKANPNRNAQGIILESRIDKGKGTVANVLIQNGTLKVGDPFVAGSCFGRVRAMENEKGQRIQQAGPSTPLQLTGFDETPQAGDRLVVPKDERTAKEIATQRQQIRREQSLRNVKHLTLDDLSRRMALGEVSELNIIIKADVDGSIEALSGALQKLGSEEVSVNIIHTGSGAITESDVLLASASDAIIIGFQVRPTAAARKLAEAESIDVRLFSVIYDAVDEVHDALEGMLSPEISEEIKAMVSVRDIFKVSKVGTIAGCYVTEGKVTRNNPIRVIRDGVVIYEGRIDSLKRFKEDVREVQSGYECGISIENFNDIKVGDEFESYTMVESKRKLSDVN
jgi:translation initiation factor IF-2